MRKERLSKVYLDDYPITLMGDEATPPLSRIVRAGGKRPSEVEVFLTSPSDGNGRPVDPEEIIDRAAEPTRPIYLRTVPREGKPIHTADRGHELSRPEVRRAFEAPASRMPNVDPAIAQLGGPRRDERPPHEEGVFRSPSQTMGRAPPAAEAQARAEAEAEERQEEERNQEDALQDEQEARREAGEDREAQA